MHPYAVVEDFESALCEFTGFKRAVTTNSCTMALLLALNYKLTGNSEGAGLPTNLPLQDRQRVGIPKHTYVGVPMSIMHAGGRPTFRHDNDWQQLGYYPLLFQSGTSHVVDSARFFAKDMAQYFHRSDMVCVSFHWSKPLGIQQGGAILHNHPKPDAWLRRARFDGRTQGCPPARDFCHTIGWHCYMPPEMAAAGLVRLSFIPTYNLMEQETGYPDLSKMEIFNA